ncbi:MAG: hypothetical protein PUF59_01665 [Lachnospiraceae bacterium]|nr:hypothetical protein [Cuneatibacter sp.]MDD6455285.1 hypothetical protein [Lachnospiraceae bacterium]
MVNVLLRSLGFLLVILATFTLKKVGMFRKEDGQFLAKLMMNVTMPCVLLSAGKNIEFSPQLLIAFGLGICSNLILIACGLTSASLARYDSKIKGIYVINCAGFNVGSFALPFVQYFFDSSVLSYLCMFDIGNAIMGLGINNTIGGAVAKTGEKPSVQGTIKNLFSNPPFSVYLIVIFFAILHISLPEGLLTVVSIAGNANAFVAMGMIGLLLEISMPKGDVGKIFQVLLTRLIGQAIVSLLIWFLLPLPEQAKMVLILCIVTPITSMAPVFTKKMVGDSDIPAAANSLSIPIALGIMTALVLIFL